MSEQLDDDVLAEWLRMAETFEQNAEASRRAHGAGPTAMRVPPATVAALVREVQVLRRTIDTAGHALGMGAYDTAVTLLLRASKAATAAPAEPPAAPAPRTPGRSD